MQLIIHAPGATTAEMNAAIDAAQTAFASAGVTAWDAAQGYFWREAWDRSGFDEAKAPTEQQHAAAEVWHAAQDAARAACFRGWAPERVPPGWILEVRRD